MATHKLLILQVATTYLLLLLLLPNPTAASYDPALDIEGNSLKPGTKYYILPASGSGGGLTLKPKPEGAECPEYVAQSPNEEYKGLPIEFFPAKNKSKRILVSSDLNIAFSGGYNSSCGSQGVWRLTTDDVTGEIEVSTGGSIGNYGVDETVTNWFKLQYVGKEQYLIRYCPSFTPYEEILFCGHLGVLGDNFLGVTSPPLRVIFKKAT